MFTALGSIHSPLITCIIIIIWLLAVVVPLSNSENLNYTACTDLQYSCGNIQNVRYPFWGGDRPSFCGVSDFKLNCYTDQTYMKAFQNSSISLQVLGINTSSCTIEFSQSNLIKRCDLQDSNVSYLPTLKPILDADYRNISLFYGCTNACDSVYQPMSFSCNKTGYYFANTSIIGKTTSCSCKNNVTIHIGRRGVDELRTGNASLLSVLQRRSNVRLEYNGNFTDACSKCQKSGGTCGSAGLTSDQFLCYCQDGSQPLQCSHFQPRKSKSGAALAASILGTMVLVALIVFVKKKTEHE